MTNITKKSFLEQLKQDVAVTKPEISKVPWPQIKAIIRLGPFKPILDAFIHLYER